MWAKQLVLKEINPGNMSNKLFTALSKIQTFKQINYVQFRKQSVF
ncbi:MAG: hypothetical protein ACI96N_003112 [Arenicella sp.]|jgi:hypothetical protein